MFQFSLVPVPVDAPVTRFSKAKMIIQNQCFKMKIVSQCMLQATIYKAKMIIQNSVLDEDCDPVDAPATI
jgi:hypothetical protein